MGLRTVLPSAWRVERARQAGLRGHASWLEGACAWAAVGLVCGRWRGSAFDTQWAERWRAILTNPGDAQQLWTWLRPQIVGIGTLVFTLAGAWVLSRLLAAVVTGQLGPIDGRRRRQFVSASSRVRREMPVLTVVGLVAGTLALKDLVAACVRSVDARPSTVVELYARWVTFGWAAVLMGLMVLGVAEVVVARRRRFRALAQTREEHTEELRARGSKRR